VAKRRSPSTIGGDATDFITQAQRPASSAVGELVDFLRHNKKWWLTPIVLVLLVASVLLVLAGTAAAPFIYTLF
jgi:ABC-type microcin C transport system permease subunit YejE